MSNTFTDFYLLNCLNWRYAVKHFDPLRTIAGNDWSTLEQALVLSPSSYGLQPYRFIVIDDPLLRKRLATASYGQPQVTECSHFVVFAIQKKIDRAYIDRFIARIAMIRQVSVESLDKFRWAMVSDVIEGPRNTWIDQWSARQAYIALGILLNNAASLHIDACPMEGFDPVQYDDLLGLTAQGLNSVVACALGYRSVDDHYAHETKVRFAAKDLIDHR